MSYEPTSDDIGALKAEGGLVEYLLSTAGRSRKRPKEDAATPDQIAARRPITSPLHRPGAWPVGTRPAGPSTCDPGCDCALNNPPPSAA